MPFSFEEEGKILTQLWLLKLPVRQYWNHICCRIRQQKLRCNSLDSLSAFFLQHKQHENIKKKSPSFFERKKLVLINALDLSDAPIYFI